MGCRGLRGERLLASPGGTYATSGVMTQGLPTLGNPLGQSAHTGDMVWGLGLWGQGKALDGTRGRLPCLPAASRG